MASINTLTTVKSAAACSPTHPLTIGDVASEFGLTARTLRYYEEQGLVKPMCRTEGRFRLYDDHAIKRLRAVVALQNLGFSLAEISELLGRQASRSDALEEESQENRLTSVTETKGRLLRQQALLADKLSLLTQWQATVDERLATIESHCNPCLDKTPHTPCPSQCKHIGIHCD